MRQAITWTWLILFVVFWAVNVPLANCMVIHFYVYISKRL